MMLRILGLGLLLTVFCGCAKQAALGAGSVENVSIPASPAERVRVSDFGAVPEDGLDDTAALLAAVEKCRSLPRAALIFGKGRYDVSEDKLPDHRRLVFFEDRRDILVDGQGATLRFRGCLYPLFFNRCKNVRIQNLTLDWVRPPFSQGKVSRVDGRTVEIEVDPAYPLTGRESIKAMMDYDARTGLPVGNLDAFDSAFAKTEYPGPQKVRITFKRDWGSSLAPGTPVVLRHDVYGFNAMEFLSCEDVVLENVTVHTAPGMAMLAAMSHNITLRKVQIRIPPRSGRMMTTTADGTMFSSCSGRVQIEDCYFEGMGDDGVNVWTKYMVVQKILPPDSVLAAAPKGWRGPQPLPGETIELIHPKTMLVYSTRTVRAAELDRKAGAYRIQFTEPLPQETTVNDVACDVSRLASLRILRTTVRGNRARAFLVSTRDAVIDACHVQYQTMSGINVYCDAKRASFQGSGVRNVTIRNSEFEGCAAAPIFVYAEASSPRPGAHKDITIEGNVFRASPPMDKLRLKPDKRKYLYWTSAIYLRSVDQAIVRNNTFDGFELAAYVGASKGVTLEGNRSALPAGVFLSEESRASVVLRNNVDLNAEIDATVPWSAHYYVVGQR